MTHGTLFKFFEADDVAAASGTPLIPGSEVRDYIIPDGDLWKISAFGGGSSQGSCEVELLYSDDAGVTWTNPFDALSNKILCVFLATGNSIELPFPPGVEFTGSGTNVILRLKVKNYNTDGVAEIACHLGGYER